KVWASGVRLATEEEAKFYIDWWARRELSKHGYVTWKDDPNTDLIAFDIKRYDEQPLMRIHGGAGQTMAFFHGTCGLLGEKGWRPIRGGECEWGGCKRREADARFREAVHREGEIVERALAAGEISQAQSDEWWDLPVNGKRPEWLVKLTEAVPAP